MTHPLRSWRLAQTPRKTLSEVASLVGVTASHLSEIENFNNTPSLALAGKLSRETGIELEKFVQSEAAQ